MQVQQLTIIITQRWPLWKVNTCTKMPSLLKQEETRSPRTTIEKNGERKSCQRDKVVVVRETCGIFEGGIAVTYSKPLNIPLGYQPCQIIND